MRNSKLSNLNTSKLSTRLIEDTCSEHQGEAFTNFCSAMTCIKPLCPECIQNHYNHHKNIRTQPEIDSFKTLKNKCFAKVADILEHVGVDEGENSMNQLNSIFQTALRKIRQTRDGCKKILDSYFTNLQQFVRKKMSKVSSESSDLFLQLDKVNNIISELKLLCNKLENARSFLQSSETIIKLDADKIEEKVKDGFTNINKFKDLHRSNLVIEKNYQQKFYNFLTNTFYYGNKENLQTMPKVVDELVNKNHIQNLSRSRSRSKEFIDPLLSRSNSSQREEKYNSNTVYRDNKKQKEKDDDKKSSLSRKSSQKTIKSLKKDIIGMNTFSTNSPRKYLHFFQNDENILHLLDLEDGDDFTQIDLDINFKIPDFHKSISISNGDLYVIGGSLSKESTKSQKIFKYDFEKNTLTYCNSMKYGRSSHSVCFNNKYIYILGGFLNNQTISNKCERYDIVNNRVEEIRPMNYEACSFACCSFGGRYIYKFGGVAQNNEITHYIERYDEKTGMWEVINPSVEMTKGQQLLPLSTSAAVQITKQEIMVMGGYDASNEGQRQTYILKIEESGDHILKDINTYPLPLPEGFWNNNPIIHKKLIFVLQNVAFNNQECSENSRKILSFDGLGWQVLN